MPPHSLMSKFVWNFQAFLQDKISPLWRFSWSKSKECKFQLSADQLEHKTNNLKDADESPMSNNNMPNKDSISVAGVTAVAADTTPDGTTVTLSSSTIENLEFEKTLPVMDIKADIKTVDQDNGAGNLQGGQDTLVDETAVVGSSHACNNMTPSDKCAMTDDFLFANSKPVDENTVKEDMPIDGHEITDEMMEEKIYEDDYELSSDSIDETSDLPLNDTEEVLAKEMDCEKELDTLDKQQGDLSPYTCADGKFEWEKSEEHTQQDVVLMQEKFKNTCKGLPVLYGNGQTKLQILDVIRMFLKTNNCLSKPNDLIDKVTYVVNKGRFPSLLDRQNCFPRLPFHLSQISVDIQAGMKNLILYECDSAKLNVKCLSIQLIPDQQMSITGDRMQHLPTQLNDVQKTHVAVSGPGIDIQQSTVTKPLFCKEIMVYEFVQKKGKSVGVTGQLVAIFAIFEGLKLLCFVVTGCLLLEKPPELLKQDKDANKQTKYPYSQNFTREQQKGDRNGNRHRRSFRQNADCLIKFAKQRDKEKIFLSGPEKISFIIKYKNIELVLECTRIDALGSKTRLSELEKLYFQYIRMSKPKGGVTGLHHPNMLTKFKGKSADGIKNQNFLFEMRRDYQADDITVNVLGYGTSSSRNIVVEESNNGNSGYQNGSTDTDDRQRLGNCHGNNLKLPENVNINENVSDVRSSDLFGSRHTRDQIRSHVDGTDGNQTAEDYDVNTLKLPETVTVYENMSDVKSSDLFGNIYQKDTPGSKLVTSQRYTDIHTSELFGEGKNMIDLRNSKQPKSTTARNTADESIALPLPDFGEVGAGARPKIKKPDNNGFNENKTESIQSQRVEMPFHAYRSRFATQIIGARKMLRLGTKIVERAEVTAAEHFDILCGSEIDLDRYLHMLQSEIPYAGVVINEDLKKVVTCDKSFPEDDFDDYSFQNIKKLGKGFFRVRDTLGQGTYGVAYWCTAIIPTSKERFQFVRKKIPIEKFNTAEILVPLHHAKNCPQILKIYGAYREHGYMNILMEYAPGESLYKVIRYKPEKISDYVYLTVCVEHILKGLQYLHTNDIVVFDLKVENIVLRNSDDPSTVAIIDWGSSKSKNQSLPLNYRNGTSIFQPPEFEMFLNHSRFQNHLKAIDVWALGCVLYKCLTKQTIWKNVRDKFCKNKDGSEELRNHIRKCSNMVYEEIAAIPQKENILQPVLIHLLTRLLDPCLTSRITVAEALQHPVFTERRRLLIPDTVQCVADGSEWTTSSEMERKFLVKSDTVNDRNKVWVTLVYLDKMIAIKYIKKGSTIKELYKETEDEVKRFVPNSTTGYYFRMQKRFSEDCVVELRKCT